VIERITFDAERALDDPDLTLLDVGHPLVRRLIEEVKQSTFRMHSELAKGYGRTAYIVTPDVEEVTALFHLLERYVVNTNPTSIIEELLPVAVPVYGDEVLDPQVTRHLLGAKPGPETRTAAEVQETLEDTFAIAGLEALLGAAVEARRQELMAERQSMRKQMEQRQGAQMAEWLQGIDDLSPGSLDMLTVTVYYPA